MRGEEGAAFSSFQGKFLWYFLPLLPGQEEKEADMRKREKKKSVVRQVEESLNAQLAIGRSKYADKRAGATESRIYSWDTYRAYLRHSCDFAKWCQERYKSGSLEGCKAHAAEYIQELTAAGRSPSTLKLVAAAIAKTYRCSVADLGIATPPRRRAGITRSRGPKPSDKHFSEENNRNLVEFCKGTGLRNHKELQKLRGAQLELREDGYWLADIKGKGGKVRALPVLPEYADTVVRLCEAAGDGLVWPHVSSHADVHSYRADYASAWYKLLARPVDQIPAADRYVCRRDKAGVVYDKTAMLQVSRFLGHNRINVIAEHYLH